MSSRPPRLARPVSGTRRACVLGGLGTLAGVGSGGLLLALPSQANEPVSQTISPAQRAAAQQVARNGVPLSALAADAPAAHTVQPGDTLWAIASLFLTSPWRWPELWGMNLQDIRNPHLIYPGQTLVLVKNGDRAQLRLAQAGGADGAGQAPTNTVRLSPRVRSQVLDNGAIASIPLQLIAPFLNEALVLDQDSLANAPRIVASQEGRVMISRGEIAYVRGDLRGARSFTLFRESKPLKDPGTDEVLGYEASYVGVADFVRAEGTSAGPTPSAGLPVPATFVMSSARQEAGVGDRLAPVAPRDYTAYVPHPPATPLAAQVLSVYGESLVAGQNQIVAINRGQRDGVERGHVMALWRAGAPAVDRTGARPQALQLPDERTGLVFVFRVFERVSYALILSALDPVRRGDRVTQP